MNDFDGLAALVTGGASGIGRLVSAAEIAQTIAYLASPDAGATTGEILRVDGGMTTLRV